MDPAIPSTWDTRPRASKITMPRGPCNPLARLVFGEMKRQGVTYFELESRAGVLGSTVKSWRNEKTPGLLSISAALGALGISLVPVPRMDQISPRLRAKVSEIAREFVSDEQALGALIGCAVEFSAETRALVRESYKAPPSRKKPK